MAHEKSLADIEILARLPNYFDPSRGGEIPSDLIGATILCIGAPAEDLSLEGGGLVVDYLPAGSKDRRRIIFAFNGNGMWVEFSSPAQPSSPMRG